MRRRRRDRNRAVSTTLSYVLTLAIAAMLISGLLLATGTLVEGQQDSVARDNLEVIGQQLAGDIQTADRLVESGAEDVVVWSDHQERVADGGYTTTVNVTGENVTLVLESDRTDATIRTPVANETVVREASFRGGDVVIERVDGELEVRRA